MAPGHEVRSSPERRAGRNFAVANGAPLPNLGEQMLSMVTDECMETPVLFQLCDVTRPLLSVSAICDYGNRVIFGRSGGIIHNVETGLEIPFARQDGIYSIRLWLQEKQQETPAVAAKASVSALKARAPGFSRP